MRKKTSCLSKIVSLSYQISQERSCHLYLRLEYKMIALKHLIYIERNIYYTDGDDEDVSRGGSGDSNFALRKSGDGSLIHSLKR